MGKVAVVTILFDYPSNFTPIFEDKLLKDINKEDYYVIRYNSESDIIKNESYYFKFKYFRIKKFVEFVKNILINKYEYFILLDATDVGYVGGINDISKILNEYNCNILFGAEINLWPNTEYSYLHETKNIKTAYKFLNAGVFCAKTQHFVTHVENIINRGLFGLCDQGNWQIEYLLSHDIELDYKNKLVFNTYLAKNDIVVNDDTVIFKNNIPIFVHDNGGYNEETIKITDYFK